MSDPNEDAKNKIAKAIVYAARQAFMINSYGMTWEAIEINTANILAGCSVPADGKMNSAEAVSNHIYDMLKRGLISPYEARTALAEPVSPGDPTVLRVALELVDKYHEQKNELARTKEALRIEATAAQKARQELVQLRNSMIPHPHHSRLAELEARNVDLRLMLERSQEDREMDVTRLEQDRDGLRKGAQYWYDQTTKAREECHAQAMARNAAKAKVVKLRTFLERKWCNVCSCDTEAIATILEETK